MKAKAKRPAKSRTIRTDYLARVEGEGAMYVRIQNGNVRDVKLKIFEPPRYFEAFLRGRSFREVPDITARICGICPIAYQMSSVHALESILGVEVAGPLRDLRRLIYCGEWIESHVLHIFLLHAPDFLGYESAIHMAKDHRELVETALQLKKLGNGLMTCLGGREVHPINVRVGGFYKTPRRRDLLAWRDRLEWGLNESARAAKLLAGFDFPDFEQDYEFVALRHPHEYPLCEGRLASSRGLDIGIDEFERYFQEEHVAHSNALHCTLAGDRDYFVGPMARYAVNFDRLSPAAQTLAREIGLGTVCRNPFQSILVRTVETFWAFEEALSIIERYEEPDAPYVEVEPRAGTGYGCSEAPRGICWHTYQIDDAGTVLRARIVPPTSQNQRTIESDLRHFVERHVDLPDNRLQWQCEQAIRNYDPCISCATHFLRLTIDRDD